MIRFTDLEEKILTYWQEHDIFKKSIEARKGRQSYVVFEGPPTANARPGLHHVLARVFKDLIPRFKTMQGYYVERKAGWDTHGLPVELQIEKKLGFTNKAQIEAFGIAEFNAQCKQSVWEFKKDHEKLTERIAYWLDMSDPYITYTSHYIESVWWIIKQIHDKGMLYLGHRVAHHCVRCGTTLSSHEVAQGYKTVKDTSVYVKFKTVHEPNASFLAWTTTPWTLPGNVALAVNPDVLYARVRSGDEEYYIAHELIESVLGESADIQETMKGSQLVGMEYLPLFKGALDAGKKRGWRVVPASFVTTTDGTGIVHIAPMYGEDDYKLGIEHELPLVHTVREDGTFVDTLPKLGGRFVKDKTVEDGIIEFLSAQGLFLKSEAYEHEYPFCWRCDTPLLYYAKSSWYIRTSAVKDRMIEGNKTVHWKPEHIGQGRFGEWLKNLRDWAISRERYWGTPLPVWMCEEGHIEVVGSVAELKERAINFSEIYPADELDLHRPFIDSLVMTCARCGQEMSRVKEVLDVWFDSGAMPLAQWHYPFERAEKIDEKVAYPADYISEAIDQTRGWFYTLLAVATLLDMEPPYRHVICLGHMLDKKGHKMSKSKGNVVDPWELIGEHGADAARFYMFTVNQPGEVKRFDAQDVREVVRSTCLVLWNVVTFYELYAGSFDTSELEKKSPHSLDRWMRSRLHALTRDVTRHLEEYEVFEAGRLLAASITELSTWYVRRSRDRFKGEREECLEAVATLREVLLTLVKLLAPFMPFLSDEIYQRIAGGRGRESVHLEDWPQWDEGSIDADLEHQMEQVRQAVEMLHALRAEAGIKVRQPLSIAYLSKPFDNELISIIQDEVNVKELGIVETITASDETIVKEEGGFSVGLRTYIDESLKEEGYLRELVRHVNAMRKNAGLTVKDMIVLSLDTKDEEMRGAIERQVALLQGAVLARKVEFTAIANMQSIQIDGRNVDVHIAKT